MSETMVERVAKAIASRHSLDLKPEAMTYNMDNVLVPYWTLYAEDARAAIQAMREPPQRMVAVGTDARWRSAVRDADNVREIWTHMIDAALSPTPE